MHDQTFYYFNLTKQIISKAIIAGIIMTIFAIALIFPCNAETSGLINIQKSEISIGRGSSKTLKVSTEGDIGTLIWSSSNKSVASVDKNGKVKGESRGSAYITCKSSEDTSISDKCKVNVKFGKNETVWLAHKGYSSKAPENTAVAVREAALAGFDGAEIDVWESKAEKSSSYKPYLLLSHNPNLRSYTGKSKKITSITHSNRKKYPITKGNGIKKYGKQPIPTLEEALKAAWSTADSQGNPDFIVELDIKQENISTSAVKKIVRLAGNRNVRINTYYFDVAKKFKKYRKNKKMQIWVSCGSHSTWNSKAFIRKAADLGLNGVSMSPGRWTSSVMQYAKHKKVQRAAFTNNPDKINKLLKAGFDRICTNKKMWAN